MGKNLIQQRRGRGVSLTYTSPGHRFRGQAELPREEGTVADLINCPGHSSPLMILEGKEGLAIAPEGIRIGDQISIGERSEIKKGNVLQLKDIPEGTTVYNIENNPGDGGRFVRACGTFAKIVAKTANTVVIKLPSKKEKTFHPNCRAAIGIVAGSGRSEKPLLKAGTMYHKMRARNKLYPSVSGTSMNAVDHPFGGSCSHSKGKPTIAPKNAPPGRKVGKLRPRRTGKKK
ncbi:MAG: 50S ribosomal protein L2 [Candidatus Woesearchaeota archaeon]